MESLSKQANKCDPQLIFFYKKWVSTCHAFCKTWSVVEHGVECYFGVLSFSFSKITTQSHRGQLMTSYRSDYEFHI